ncbi:hypothetical protein AJ80_00113 [Polytolypa hystricis UAMH7299]|uniref:PI-PLC Y-box domain-containing protein n=1 Tax=Polytolypa hystricis (strain UAMH7299) TaxID=1447883 RepID=A0A2B7Z4R0_POLH7|nr:hypothetical protein AJ80_00113 [Polytolypa hystricis UAMH7299]
MPSPAPRRTSQRGSAKSTPTKQKPLDIGQPLGVYDTNSVREKVRKWQQQGGGVVTAPDVGAESDNENDSPALKPTPRQAATPTRDLGNIKKEEGDDDQDRGDGRVRSNSAPKKRLVSDEHWKKNRNRTNTTPSSVAPRKRAELLSRYTDSTSTLGERDPVSKSTPTSAGSKIKSPNNDGIRVYATPTASARKESQRKDRSHTLDTGSSRGDDEESVLPKRTPKSRTPVSSRASPVKRSTKDRTTPNFRKSETDLSISQYDREDTAEPSERVYVSEQESKPLRRHQHAKPRSSPRAPKGGVLTHMVEESKKIFAKHESPALPPPPQPRRSKIESWLSNTPDPFVDGDGDSAVGTPAPAPTTTWSDNDNDSQTEKKTKRTVFHRRVKRQDSHVARPRSRGADSAETSSVYQAPTSSDISRDPHESSPSTTLTRKGAKGHVQSPPEARRMSMLKESVEEALKGSAVEPHSSSDGSEVSYTDRPPPLTLRRPFPGTGAHRLSTILSVDTVNSSSVSTTQDPEPDPQNDDDTSTIQAEDKDVSDSETRDKFDELSLSRPNNGLKRRLTTHADLISVLSIPGGGSKSIRSARSIRTNRSRLATATIGDLMQELTSDETKYMRELRTLVGGVIPVLLTCVLSKSDSAIAAGLFRPSANPKDDENFTRPIVNMGIALERLKSMHKRVPLDNPESLLSWAQGAHRIYSDYLKAWRLGFQDVVVNLAPPGDADSSMSANFDNQSLYAGMAQDEDGDVVDGDGEKVDVAFLLKRPLVRLKYLAKTFKGINYITPSTKAEETSSMYQTLVTDARRRFNEERARLEDDSAASVDATRARSPRTMAVLTDVAVNQKRRVRARDSFNLSLLHTSGQEIDCRAELLLRDNPPGEPPGGDMLICEVDGSGRWLLFPPIDYGRASARKGDEKGEVVVMIRGVPGEEADWKELLTLKTDDEHIALEWIHLIGLSPVPPKINRSMSFLNRSKNKTQSSRMGGSGESLIPKKNRSPSPTTVDVPIGEQATVVSPALSAARDVDSTTTSSTTLTRSKAVSSPSSRIMASSMKTPTKSPLSISTSPRDLNDAMAQAGGVSPTTGLKRTKAQRRSKYGELSMLSPTSRSPRTPEREMSSPDRMSVDPCKSDPKPDRRGRPTRVDSRGRRESFADEEPPNVEFEKPIVRRSLSPVPSLDLPTIPKLRKGSQKSVTPEPTKSPDSSPPVTPKSRDRAKGTPEKKGEFTSRRQKSLYSEDVPPPPPQRSPSPAVPKHGSPPVLSPSTPRFYGRTRRTSSPLKHEYEPSTATESSASETSTVERYSIDSCSESEMSDEELEEYDDIATPLPPVAPRQVDKVPPRASPPNVPDATLDPSNSASQAPYKRVPSQSINASKTIASMFYWHDKGTWEPLYPDECRIVVSPGLIEAYEMSAPQSQPVDPDNNEQSDDSRPSTALGDPLIALELTPLVPIRRGTALDISIRSPPTPRSTLNAGNNNVMFRSRNAEECEKLYGLINQARINNPTYIALQNARGPYSNSTQPAPLARQNSTARQSKFGSWFSWYGGLTKSSYRASSAPTPSVAGVTESSVGTMSSAFSALKRFGGGSKMFSIARSSITSRTGGSRGGSLYSSSSGSGPQPYEGDHEDAKNTAGGIGLSNAKIRLYRRESASKWRDMGAARLTILPGSPVPSRPGTSADTSTSPPNGGGAPTSDGFNAPPLQTPPAAPVFSNRQEKRILIRGKTHGEVLLDVCLGESCFERVARTGIAVSVWEEFADGIPSKQGGVVAGSFTVYMIQMKGEAETAYTFGLVGKLRY